jgi:hypothetical protein
MELWNTWLALVNQLEACCSRKQTFFWLVTILIGFTIKFDFLGVTSIARGVGLLPNFYTCMLHFFNSTAVNLEKLQLCWINLILSQFSSLVRINDKHVIIGDGIKVGKEGKKMPAVKWLHQDSESNSKAEYIMGHSIQAIGILAKGLSTYFAIPLVGKIHEGIRFNYKDSRTLLDKMFEMLVDLKLPAAFYFVADKYYCSGRFMKQLVGGGIHIITMMKKNACAYYPAKPESRRRGRPKKYGKSVKLFDLFKTDLNFIEVPLPGNSKLMIEYCVIELFWRPLGDLAQFVFVRHPERGNSIVMSTDLKINPLDIIICYSLRFKIEVLFKQAIHQVGVFMYRFWLKIMLPRKRGSGDQLLQFAPAYFKEKVLKKLHAYHLFIQLGFISQGLMQYLSIHCHQVVWKNFGTWLRTIREHILPSEKVVALSLSRTYIEFLVDGKNVVIFKKFLQEKTDISQLQGSNFEQREAA